MDRAEVEAVARAIRDELHPQAIKHSVAVRVAERALAARARVAALDAVRRSPQGEPSSRHLPFGGDGQDHPSPQGEDHEAAIEAAMRAFDDAAAGGFDALRDEEWPEHAMRRAIAAYLSRCPSPERDTVRLVERLHNALLAARDFVPEPVWRAAPEVANQVEETLNDAADFLAEFPAASNPPSG